LQVHLSRPAVLPRVQPVPLRALLRQGISDDNLKLALRQAIFRKPAEHLFKDSQNTARDSRAMYQVGG
jgi:cyclic pyranopterin phosphate synthase